MAALHLFVRLTMSRTRANGEGLPLLSSELDSVPEYDALNSDPQFESQEVRKKLEGRLLQKLDIRMSILVVIYILNYIDRNSAAAARLRGFEDELHLEGAQFASVLSIFYVGYVLMQVPSNMFLSQIGKPSVYLPCCMMGWGAISFCTGFVTNYHGALLTRFLLGLVEAVFFPGALFLIAKWYKRSELSRRTAYFICGNLVSMAFGPLIASAILDVMDGVLGYTAWRWLFFIEGALTVLVAVLALSVLPDFPEAETIRWLAPAEHALARRRMAEDAAGAPYLIPSNGFDGEGKLKGGAITGFMMAVSDWKVWYLAIVAFAASISSSFGIYFPTLVSTMGYNSTVTLLLCAPPWVFGAIWALWLSRHSDRTGERCMYIVVSCAMGVGGFLLAMSTMDVIVRYISFFLMVQGSTGPIFFYVWVSSTVSNPPAKRAVALAFINSFLQSGSIVGSYFWPKSWGPTYNKSYATCTVASLLCIIMCLWLRKKLEWLNEEMDMADERDHDRIASEGKGWRYHL